MLRKGYKTIPSPGCGSSENNTQSLCIENSFFCSVWVHLRFGKGFSGLSYDDKATHQCSRHDITTLTNSVSLPEQRPIAVSEPDFHMLLGEFERGTCPRARPDGCTPDPQQLTYKHDLSLQEIFNDDSQLFNPLHRGSLHMESMRHLR